MKYNNKFRSAAAIALALVMTTSALTSCTGGGKKPSVKPGTSQTQQETPKKDKDDKKTSFKKDDKPDKKQDIPEIKLPAGSTDKDGKSPGSLSEGAKDDKGSTGKGGQEKDDKGSASKGGQEKDDKGSTSKDDKKKTDKKVSNKGLKKKTTAKTPSISSDSLKKAPAAKAGK